MGRTRTFIGAGLTAVVFGGWALGFWYASGWTFLLQAGGILAGVGLLLVLAGAYFRWQGWE